jgi:hypothetical protein
MPRISPIDTAGKARGFVFSPPPPVSRYSIYPSKSGPLPGSHLEIRNLIGQLRHGGVRPARFALRLAQLSLVPHTQLLDSRLQTQEGTGCGGCLET